LDELELSTSGWRTICAVERLPESSRGPNFWVARRGIAAPMPVSAAIVRGRISE
jgi:hypothetical protein